MANLDNMPNREFSDISDCELQSALHTYENDECSFMPCAARNNARVFRQPVSTDDMEQLKSVQHFVLTGVYRLLTL